MEKLKIIRDSDTYYRYCNLYEEIITECIEKGEDESLNDDAAMLWLLIQDYDKRNDIFGDKDYDPVQYLKLIMKNHGLKDADLAKELGVGKSLISKVLNYKQAISFDLVKKITKRFKVFADPFLKDYSITNNSNKAMSA